MRYAIYAVAVVLILCAISYRCRQAREDDGTRVYFNIHTGERSVAKPKMPATQLLRIIERRAAASTQES